MHNLYRMKNISPYDLFATLRVLGVQKKAKSLKGKENAKITFFKNLNQLKGGKEYY